MRVTITVNEWRQAIPQLSFPQDCEPRQKSREIAGSALEILSRFRQLEARLACCYCEKILPGQDLILSR